jgi:hypothetical protein
MSAFNARAMSGWPLLCYAETSERSQLGPLFHMKYYEP